MARIELTDKETACLIEALEDYVLDLKTERIRTDDRKFESWLVTREVFVNDVLDRVRAL